MPHNAYERSVIGSKQTRHKIMLGAKTLNSRSSQQSRQGLHQTAPKGNNNGRMIDLPCVIHPSQGGAGENLAVNSADCLNLIRITTRFLLQCALSV